MDSNPQSSPLSTNKIYRPSLSLADINTLLEVLLVQSTVRWTPAMKSAYKKLHLFKVKIESDAIVPASPGIQHMSAADAIMDTFSTPATSIQKLRSAEDFAAGRKSAFLKWQHSPISCSVHELELVSTYRYENDLMNAEEKAAFENELMKED